jgi:hypothetical protein
MLSSVGQQFSELGLSSSLRSGGEPKSDQTVTLQQPQRNVLQRPNLNTLNYLNDEIEKVVDSTAEQVRATFENFLSRYSSARTRGVCKLRVYAHRHPFKQFRR